MDSNLKRISLLGMKLVSFELMGSVITVVENEAENPQPAQTAALPGGAASLPPVVADAPAPPPPAGVAPLPPVVAYAPAPPPPPPAGMAPLPPVVADAPAPPPPPAGVAPLPPAIANAIRDQGGTHLMYVCTKVLTPSDVRKRSGRLYVSKTDSLLNYLNEDERRIITEGTPEGIEVHVVDSGGVWYQMVLRRWPKESTPAFNKGWTKVVGGMKLKAGNRVELWFFRKNARLGVAVAVNNV